MNKYLLYCIFRSQRHESHRTLRGVQGQPVSLVTNNCLSAAVSGIPDCELTLDMSSVLAYQKVIESLHSHPAVGGVIPMRYGCVFNGQSQVQRLLKERYNQYEVLLEGLEGCVEMGVRILISNCCLPNGDSETSIQQIENPGRAYLAARKAHYAQDHKFNRQVEHVIEQYRAAFNGLFVKCKTESPSTLNHQSSIISLESTIRNPVLSLYFLVRREHLGRFRQVLRQVNVSKSARLLLSGPWPPYNFVQLDPAWSQHCTFPSFYKGTNTKGGKGDNG